VIRRCKKLTKLKYYYVRNIVLPVGRNHILEEELTEYEKEAMKFNEELRERNPSLYF